MSEVNAKLIELEDTKKKDEDMLNNLSAYIAFLVNEYVRAKEGVLESSFVSKLML